MDVVMYTFNPAFRRQRHANFCGFRPILIYKVSFRIARIMKKDQQFVRQAMIKGILPIGVAFMKEGSKQYDYYISPKLFYEFTGYVYNEILE